MTPDVTTIRTYYSQAFSDFLGAIDQMTDLYDVKKLPNSSEFVFAQTRLTRAAEKLETVIKIAKFKYGIDFGAMPIYLRQGGRA